MTTSALSQSGWPARSFSSIISLSSAAVFRDLSGIIMTNPNPMNTVLRERCADESLRPKPEALSRPLVPAYAPELQSPSGGRLKIL